MNESANTLLLAALLMVGGVNSRFLTVHPANADSRPSPHMIPALTAIISPPALSVLMPSTTRYRPLKPEDSPLFTPAQTLMPTQAMYPSRSLKDHSFRLNHSRHR